VGKFQREEIDVIGDLIQSRAKRVIETSVTCTKILIMMIVFIVIRSEYYFALSQMLYTEAFPRTSV
jgi:hypothetical protein